MYIVKTYKKGKNELIIQSDHHFIKSFTYLYIQKLFKTILSVIMPLTRIEEKLSETCKEITISCESSLVHHAMLWKIMLKNITLAVLWCVTFISTVFV